MDMMFRQLLMHITLSGSWKDKKQSLLLIETRKISLWIFSYLRFAETGGSHKTTAHEHTASWKQHKTAIWNENGIITELITPFKTC